MFKNESVSVLKLLGDVHGDLTEPKELSTILRPESTEPFDYSSAEEKAAERSSMMKDSSSMPGPSSAGDAPNLGSTPPRAAAAGTRAGKQPVVKLDSPKSAKKLKLG